MKELAMRAVPITFLALLLAATGLLTACSRGSQESSAPLEQVTIAVTGTSDSVLAQVAQVQGYYRAEGVDTTVRLEPYGKLCLQQVLQGKADLATVAETPVMFAVMEGAQLSIIATIQTSKVANVIVARKDLGVRALKDLKGRKVGVTKGTSSEYFLDAVLAGNGIARNQVEVVDLKAEKMVSALARGEVHAVSTFNTYGYPARKTLGERAAWFQDESMYTATFNLVATRDFVMKRPATIRKILRALARAEEFVRSNPNEAQLLVARFSQIDAALLQDLWPDANFELSLDQFLLLVLEDESRWAIRQRLTKSQTLPNYLDYIYLDGLRAVKPDAMRILR